jgi:ferrous iron transport protein B
VSAAPRLEPAPMRVVLVGNPNTGKSTLFNALTGLRQRAANFPGVTVERMEGSYLHREAGEVRVVDLPGCYSLSAQSADEMVALDALLGRVPGEPVPDVVVVVVDAEQLERNLFLASQVMELGLPTVIALNRMDVLEAEGATVDVPELIHELGVTVIPVVATRGDGLEHLRNAIAAAPRLPRPTRAFALRDTIERALEPVVTTLVAAGEQPSAAAMHALRLVGEQGGGADLRIAAVPRIGDALAHARSALANDGLHPDSVEAEARYGWIAVVVSRTVRRVVRQGRTRSDRVDAVMLHKLWGPLVFVALMALMFQGIFTWSRPLTEGIDALVAGAGQLAGSVIPPGDLRSLVVDGMIGGVGSVLAFVPQIFVLFLFIGILEDSGYMSRAAFVMDRFLRPVGLHGKSFIPLVSGYACAVPAIMSARTIQEPKDRLATIMVVPLMSCSARLPVYTLLIGAFVPPVALAGVFDLQGVTLLGMYALGTAGAFLAASVFRRTLLRGPMRPMIIELPSYRMPSARTLLTSVWHRVRLFLVRAGTVIFAVSIVLWALASYPKTTVPSDAAPDVAREAQLSGSVLGRMGHAIEPAVRPLGYDWKIGVSMLASFSAREVFVSTMATIHGVSNGDEGGALTEQLRRERDPSTGRYIYTPLIAIGLLVFYVFAPMCMSTLTVTSRETGGGRRGLAWSALQAGYMFGLAYVAAYTVFHAGQWLGFGG